MIKFKELYEAARAQKATLKFVRRHHSGAFSSMGIIVSINGQERIVKFWPSNKSHPSVPNLELPNILSVQLDPTNEDKDYKIRGIEPQMTSAHLWMWVNRYSNSKRGHSYPVFEKDLKDLPTKQKPPETEEAWKKVETLCMTLVKTAMKDKQFVKQFNETVSDEYKLPE